MENKGNIGIKGMMKERNRKWAKNEKKYLPE